MKQAEFTWVKKKESDHVWWKAQKNIGDFEFSLDQKKVYNLFKDYPDKLTPEERAVFDAENPYWVDFFSGRSESSV